MHRIMSSPRNGDQAFRQTPRNVVQTFRQALRSVLLGAAAAAIFVTTTYGQINDSIRGPPARPTISSRRRRAGCTRRRHGASPTSRPR